MEAPLHENPLHEIPMTRLLLLVAFAAALVVPRPGQSTDAPEPVQVFLVRHAEKVADGTRDPLLTEEGEARAEALARLLGEAGVTHLYSTDLERTRRTLAPLPAALESEVRELPARDVQGLLGELQALPAGSVAVVSGHSNTVPWLVRSLGGEVPGLPQGNLDEKEYDRLFLVTLATDGSAATSLELRYGAPSAD